MLDANWTTPCNTVIHKELTDSQLVKKLPILKRPKVHYRLHKSAPTVSHQSHIHPVHILQTHFSKNHFNTVLSQFPFPVQVDPPKHSTHFQSFLNVRSRRLALLILLKLTPHWRFINSPLSFYPAFVSRNVFLSTLFSKTLRLCSFITVRQQVSHPYTTGYIRILYNLYLEPLRHY